MKRNWTRYEDFASGLDTASEEVVKKHDSFWDNLDEKLAWNHQIHYELNLKPIKPRHNV
jgi:hypothetical protein